MKHNNEQLLRDIFLAAPLKSLGRLEELYGASVMQKAMREALRNRGTPTKYRATTKLSLWSSVTREMYRRGASISEVCRDAENNWITCDPLEFAGPAQGSKEYESMCVDAQTWRRLYHQVDRELKSDPKRRAKMLAEIKASVAQTMTADRKRAAVR